MHRLALLRLLIYVYILLFMTNAINPEQHALLIEIATSCRCNNLRRAVRTTTAFYNAYLHGTGLTAAQCPLLVTLILAGPQQIQDLALLMVLDRTTLTRNLRVLVTQGYVHMAPGADQRTRMAQITDEGRAALLAALPQWQAAQREFIAAIGATTSTELLAACQVAASIDLPESSM
jgi:DNA-binding MarR family transcriptional regulator